MGDVPTQPAAVPLRRLLAFLLVAGLLAGCSSSGSKRSAEADAGSGSVTADAPAAGDEPPTTLPPGAVAGLEDFDGDGQPDPTCGTQDFGAGLVLRIPCTITTPNEPEQGTVLVNRSLFRLPGALDVDLNGVSGSLVLGRDPSGARVVVVVFNTDALFQTGSATIGSTDTLDGIIRVINAHYPRSSIQVRGHTDSTGSATVNQSLSERRAATVRDYLAGHGLNAPDISSVGLGSTQPLTEEHNADGSDSPLGRRFNRRVELVVRPR